MQKIITFLIIGCSLSLIAMQTEQEKWQATCKAWGNYLLKAARAQQVDPAMIHQIAANMRREKCEGAEGSLARNNVAVFEDAGAIVACMQGFRPALNAIPISLTSPEPVNPYDICHFKFKQQ